MSELVEDRDPLVFEGPAQALGLFYFYVFLHQERARVATTKSFSQCLQGFKAGQSSPNRWPALIVHSTNKYMNKLKDHSFLGVISVGGTSFRLPSKTDLGPWQQFRKEADQEILFAVLWSRVLKIKDEHIAQGLDISVGAVRHRVSRGLRLLGRMSRVGAGHV